MRRFILPLLILTAIMAVSAASYAAADEYRAFWVDAWHAGFLRQSEVDKLLGVVGDPNSKGDIRNANCNTIIMQVRRNCDANYPSSMGEPYMGGLSPANFNSLQAVLNAAHDTTGGKQRIEVHAWIVTFRTSGGAVYLAHDDTPTGSLTTLDNYWPSRTSAGAETSDKAFDPGHPLAEEYTVNVCMDLVNNFDIDGVHYDYIRFTAGNQGYNPTSIARYNARFGLTGQPSSTNDQFDQWRRDQVSCLVRKVYAKVQASKPSVKVSGAFVTWDLSPTASTDAAWRTTRPYGNVSNGVFSDWDSWMKEGTVDMGVPMNYYNYATAPTGWNNWSKFIKDRKYNRHAIVGPGIYLNNLTNAIYELKDTRLASPAGNYANGFSGYSYFLPYISGNWAGFSPTLISQVTPDSANIPVMPWKTSPTKGHISGTCTYSANAKWVDYATVSITGPETRSMLTDGTGFYAFIDLTTGNYTMTVSKSGYPDIQRAVNVQIGAVTGNMYVNDFSVGGTPPPPITNIQATSIATNSATITWDTVGQPATSQVKYGATMSYGNTTPLDSNLVTSHSVALSGLTPGTTYHYQVISTNANGTSASGDYTFASLADITAPVMGSLTDDDRYTLSTTTLNGAWSATDPESGIQRYEYAVGTTPGGTNTKGWTSAGTATSAAIGGLTLSPGSAYYVSARAVNGANLTSTPMTANPTSGVTVAILVAGISAAKGYADGTPVYLPAQTITAKYGPPYYIESEDRSSGICVDATTTSAVGQAVPVYGKLGLVNGGERALKNCKVVEPGGAGTVIDPLAMNMRSIGGGASGSTPGIAGSMDLNNLGLLVTIMGTVTKKQTGFIYVDDGSALDDGSTFAGIRVDTSGLSIVPNETQYVIITGISSVFNNGTSCVRMIRPKGDAYVTIYTP